MEPFRRRIWGDRHFMAPRCDAPVNKNIPIGADPLETAECLTVKEGIRMCECVNMPL